MSRDRLPPPDPPACLVRPYSSSQKGGTMIAEDVQDLATHKQRLCDPDGYRPARCGRCGHEVLHVHQYRQRLLLADPDEPVTTVVVHQCAHPDCRATWRILPAFLARWLWRSWRTVAAATVAETPSPSLPEVPERTVRRWSARLASAARHLVQVLAAAGDPRLWAVASAVGLRATRRELAIASSPEGRRLAPLAALVHRLCAGARLM